jgi:hypothetical protein
MLAARRNTTANAGFLRRGFEFSEATGGRQILLRVLELLTPPPTRRPQDVSAAAWPKPHLDLTAFWSSTKVIRPLVNDQSLVTMRWSSLVIAFRFEQLQVMHS